MAESVFGGGGGGHSVDQKPTIDSQTQIFSRPISVFVRSVMGIY